MYLYITPPIFSYRTVHNFEPSFQARIWVLQALTSLNAAERSSLYVSHCPWWLLEMHSFCSPDWNAPDAMVNKLTS